MKGLIIKSPWIDMICEGKKTWEIRSKNAKIRGKIALIKSGTGTIIGTANLVDSHLLSLSEYQLSQEKHRIEDVTETPYPRTHAWVLEQAELLEEPIPYRHPKGAVIWVNLPDDLF